MTRSDKAFNFAACAIDAIGFPLGNAFFATTTVLPIFLSQLGAGSVEVGLLQATINLLTYLPGLLVVGWLKSLRRTRGFLFWVAILERLALLPLAFLAPLWGHTHPSWLLWATFLCMAGNAATMGINLPAYWAVIGKCIPASWRGRLFGYSGGIGGLLGIGADTLLRRVVFSGPDGGFPDGFARGFFIGFVILTVSVLPLAFVREPESEPHTDTDPNTGSALNFGVLQKLWRSDAPFRRFLHAQMVFAAAQMATPFFVLHARDHLGATDSDISHYTAVIIVASSLGNLIWGALADRIGNRTALFAATVFVLAGVAAALVAPNSATFYAVFALWNFGFGGIWIAANNAVLEYAGDSRQIPLYSAFYNVVNSVPRAAAPLIGGLLARYAGYPTLFAVTAACVIAALLLLRRHPVAA